jgi:hypothetical protein
MVHSSLGKTHSRPESQQKADPGSQEHARDTSAQQPQTSVHPVEPEDKRASGTNASRQREALHHNIEGGQAQQHPETPAGQHATGSFPTGTEKESRKRD